MEKIIKGYWRLAVSAAAVVLPLILLAFGVYSSFSFTFSVPLVWQVGVLGKGISSVGLKRKAFWPSIAAGALTGVILALAGGFLLKYLGMTGYPIQRLHELNSILSSHGLKISFHGEVGYKLLTAGESLKETFLYLLFSIFLIGLGEEIFWRGFIQRKISNALPKNFSIWITAAVYGLVHVYIFFFMPLLDGCIFVGLIVLAGAFWGYLYERFDNIWGAAFSHGVVAFIIWKYFIFIVQ
jgi:membrane protease YdiL (CAAX protease family)